MRQGRLQLHRLPRHLGLRVLLVHIHGDREVDLATPQLGDRLYGQCVEDGGGGAVTGTSTFAGVAVLYDTSNIMHHYPQDKHVAASMALFASIAMMFYYILRLFMSRE